MFIFQLHHFIKPEHLETYRTATQALVRDSLKAQTLLRLEVMQEKDDPTHFRLLEVYADKEARVAQLASPHFTQWRDTVFNFFAQMPYGEELDPVIVNASSSQRLNISSGAKWEDIVGYSRAVRIGDVVEVAGTTAVDESGEVVGNTEYEQTKFILQKIARALDQAGATMNDVIRTRMFVVDASKWEEVGRAHGEVFANIKPASTMVEVSALIDERLLVEIEVTAVLSV